MDELDLTNEFPAQENAVEDGALDVPPLVRDASGGRSEALGESATLPEDAKPPLLAGEGDRAAVEGLTPSSAVPDASEETDFSAQAPRNDDIPQPDIPPQPTVPPTVDSREPWAGAAPYRPPAGYPTYTPAQPQYGGLSTQEPPKKTRRWPWILLGVGIGLTLGFLLGVLLGSLRAGAVRPAQISGPSQRGDLSDRIRISDEAAGAAAPAAVYEKNVASVVGIASESTTTNAWGQSSSVASVGTGFIISEDGYVLTNYHVVEGAHKLTVMLSDRQIYEATLVGYDSDICDLALLKIDATGLQPVTFGDSDTLLVGQQVCAIGNPLGELTYTLTVGYVSAKDRIINTDGSPINMLQTDCTINAGNSGGPLFDMNGNVIGITTAKYSGMTSSGASVEGIGFAIPINDVIILIDDLQTYGYAATQPYLGVSVQIDAPAGDYPAGAYIRETVPGCAAQNAGIRGGDFITAIGEYPVDSYTGLVVALRHFSAGDTTVVQVWRDGQTLSFTLTFDARPHREETSQETEPETETDNPYEWSFEFP